MNADDATSILGVGKNMVASIDYWLLAFGIRNIENEGTPLGDYIFGEGGKDPYLEDKGTLWLLQYLLVNTDIASIYSLMFKNFRKKHLNAQFTLEQIHSDVKRELSKKDEEVASQSIEKDVRVFLKTYFVDNKKGRMNEDDLSSLLIDLELVEKTETNLTSDGRETFKIRVTDRKDIPSEIMAFFLLNSIRSLGKQDVSLSFDELQWHIADAIACNRDGLEQHIQKLQDKYNSWLVYKEDAGRREIQIKGKRPSLFHPLDEYYG